MLIVMSPASWPIRTFSSPGEVLLEGEGQPAPGARPRLDGQPEREQRVEQPPLALLQLEPGSFASGSAEVGNHLVQPAGPTEPVIVGLGDRPVARLRGRSDCRSADSAPARRRQPSARKSPAAPATGSSGGKDAAIRADRRARGRSACTASSRSAPPAGSSRRQTASWVDRPISSSGTEQQPPEGRHPQRCTRSTFVVRAAGSVGHRPHRRPRAASAIEGDGALRSGSTLAQKQDHVVDVKPRAHHERVEIARHLRGAGVPQGGIALQRLHDDGVQRGRHVRTRLGRQRDRHLDHLVQDPQLVVRAEQRGQGQHLVKHDADGEQIDPGVEAAALDRFRARDTPACP